MIFRAIHYHRQKFRFRIKLECFLWSAFRMEKISSAVKQIMAADLQRLGMFLQDQFCVPRSNFDFVSDDISFKINAAHSSRYISRTHFLAFRKWSFPCRSKYWFPFSEYCLLLLHLAHACCAKMWGHSVFSTLFYLFLMFLLFQSPLSWQFWKKNDLTTGINWKRIMQLSWWQIYQCR